MILLVNVELERIFEKIFIMMVNLDFFGLFMGNIIFLLSVLFGLFVGFFLVFKV